MPSASIENTTPFTTYSMTVTARNAIGWGAESPPVEAQFNFNKATGGTEKDFGEGEYNGLEGTWRTHTFTAETGTFTVVTDAGKDFTYVVVGGGGTGGAGNDSISGGGGGGGDAQEYAEQIAVGDYEVTAGDERQASTFRGHTANGGGNGTNGGGWIGVPGQDGYTGGNGGTSGSGYVGWGPNDPQGGRAGGALGRPVTGRNGPGLISNVSGVEVEYGYGGYIRTGASRFGEGGGGGGAAGGSENQKPRPGYAGAVIIAYRTG